MAKKETEPEAEEKRGREGPALPMVNQAHMVGRLTNAPQFKDYGGDKKRVQFGLAVPRPTRGPDGKREADFMAVVGWRALAIQCEGLSKGDAVDVQGRIRTWQDEAKRYHWDIEANVLQVLQRSKASSGNDARQRELAGV